MTFAEKLKRERAEKRLSQAALAEKAGITARTLQNYEMGKRYPATMEIAVKLAAALDTTAEELLSPGEETIITAMAPDVKRQLEELVHSLSALFSGGRLEEEDRDAAMEAIIAAYWAAKKEERKAGEGETKK